MPTLTIDDRTTTVPEGTKVITAAEKLGIVIPRFCYHPALGSAGACRVCAVSFLAGPVTGIQMSCMVEARDEMIVSTIDKAAVDFRRAVIEWLMLHHPHDCPVCDEGGHCLLQDMTVSGGHGLRRYKGLKRTHRDQYLGPLVQHEMNRCIQCYRCVRFYRDFAGYPDLGVMGIGSRLYFGRRKSGPLKSPFAGNLIDICPTGVYTDKPSRFKGRRWDFQRTQSVCIHCALGCRTEINVRYREVVRLEAGYHPEVNGWFLCDRGRYGFYYNNLENRPRKAGMENRTVSCETVLEAARKKLAVISEDYSPAAVAVVCAVHSSLETLMQCKSLCLKKGWTGPALNQDDVALKNAHLAMINLDPHLAVSMQDIHTADFVIVAGADPVNEAPMTALALRQAQQNGARIVLMDPRPVSLPCEFEHMAVAPNDLTQYLGGLVKSCFSAEQVASLSQNARTFLESMPGAPSGTGCKCSRLSALLGKSRRPLIICGTALVPPGFPQFAANCARLLHQPNRPAGLFFFQSGANGGAVAMMQPPPTSFGQIVKEIEAERIKALIVVECDPFHHFGDHDRIEHALKRLDTLIVLDYLDTPTVRSADFFLPTTTIFESGGTYINQEGRLQVAQPACAGGTPISITGHGGHPPRQFTPGIPGSEPEPAWRMLNALSGTCGAEFKPGMHGTMFPHLWEAFPILSETPADDRIPDTGLRLRIRVTEDLFTGLESPTPEPGHDTSGSKLMVIPIETIFGTEILSTFSPCLKPLTEKPMIFIHPDEAKTLGFTGDGEQAEIVWNEKGRIIMPVCLRANMARGVILIPKHPWENHPGLNLPPLQLAPHQVRPVKGGMI